MKIAVWNECYLSGGADWSLIDLVTAWPCKSDSFTIYVNRSHEGLNLITSKTVGIARIQEFSSPKELVDQLESKFPDLLSKVVLRRIIRRFLYVLACLVSALSYARLLSRSEYDVLLMNNGGYPGAISNYIVSIIAKFKRIPKRFMIVRNYPEGSRSARTIASHVCNCFMNNVIAVSQSLLQDLLDRTSIREDLLRMIHNGISIENKLGNPGEKEAFLQDRPGFSAAIIGTLEERKGHALLFKAWSQVIKAFPDAKLLIVGSSRSGNKPELLRLAEELHITDSVLWLEFVQCVGEVYNALTVVILPSQSYESFGRVVVEAMAFKKPIVASKTGGVMELINDGEDGFLFAKDDADELAKIIIRLFSSKKLREELGNAGYQKYKQRFAAEIMARNYYQLLSR